MKAIVQERYGSTDALVLRDIDRPVPKDDEVLVRVHATSLHPDVWHVLHGRPFVVRVLGAGLTRPRNRVPGTDLAGRVEAVGAAVTRFAPGDEVFGESAKGHQWHNAGAYAEYAAAPEEVLEPKPPNLTFEQAAAVPTSGSIAYQGVRLEGRVEAGQRVLVNGAGGGVGTFAVQLAKAYGAEVTGVDRGDKLGMIRSIGADHVLDYTETDFTRTGERYDVIVDIPGNRSIADCRRALTPKGTYIFIGHEGFGRRGGGLVGRGIVRFLKLLAWSPFVGQRLSTWPSKEDEKPLRVLARLIEEGKVIPVVDRTFPLGEVREAIHYLERGDARGKIVLTVVDERPVP